ncbi:MAG TPA: glycosyltransferase family 39 protein [Thermovirgaceae bacterium]|nr:glycosyltransferase family 39 protein [Thermovirgaceae bacterium]
MRRLWARPSFPFAVVLAIALVLRIYTAVVSGVPNSDAAYYIDHARIIYHGLWNVIDTRESFFFSLYPFFIAAVYPLAGNWIAAAYAVSVILGVWLLFPVYRLSQLYLRGDAALLVSLTFAVLPTLVFAGAQMLRDPVFWLFSAYGILYFARSPWKPPWFLALSSLFFLGAVLNRQEGIFFFLVSLGFLPFRRGGRLTARISSFLLPWVGALLMAGLALPRALWEALTARWHFLDVLNGTIKNYTDTAATLKALAQTPPPPVPTEFFNFASTLLWLFPLGIILYSSLEAFHYLFLLVMVVGVSRAGTGEALERDRPYFLSLMCTFFVMFYIYLFSNWAIEQRWLICMFIPAAVFLGHGYERILETMVKSLHLRRTAAVLFVAAAVVLITLPRDLSPRERDKVVYKDIGLTIAHREKADQEIPILTAGVGMRYVSLYANLNVPGAPYPDRYRRSYPTMIGRSYGEFIDALKTEGIKYFVWEEKHWPPGRYDLLREMKARDLTKIGEWYHPDSGRLILFAVN